MVGGGSNEEEGRKRLDETVGGLVWVRRRNGSWWPGQIVGVDELSENGVSSPRSGTPVKLLGRDDSSVDWYDLETTKGIKAFRCGEYDNCIEQAKISGPKFLKRSLKYPRREIAIIRALEIENTCLFKDAPSLNDKPDNGRPVNRENGTASTSRPTKDSECSSKETSSEETASAREENSNSNSTQELSHSGISYEETNGSTGLKGQQIKGKRRKTPNDSEDDGNEGFKRMKGLNDLGVRSERKIQVLALANPAPPSSVSLNGSTRAANCTAVANGGALPTFKKKRSQVVHIHELLKRKYRRRPLTKVLENTTMVPVRIICDEFANPFERSDAISPTYEFEDGTKAKETTHLLNRHHHLPLPEVDSSDVLYEVPFIDEELQPSGFSPDWKPSSSLKPLVGPLKGDFNRNFHVHASSFLEHEALDEPGPIYCASHVSQKVEKSASKWQSKGKRKARYVSKYDEMNSQKKPDVGHDKSDAYGMGLDSPGPSSNGLINGFTDLRKHISSQRSFSYHQSHSRFLVPSSLELPDVPSLTLYEVEVTVEATRSQVQHVPYISLMSKLSGKPITGHPVAVEALEDGFCDLQACDYPASGSCELDDEDTEMDFVIEPKTKHIKLQSHFPRRRGKGKKGKGKGKSSKSKKRHGSSSKKTRKLSSLTGPHKLNPEKRKPMVQTSKGPTLACVPLKIVFSRINEALNGSTRSAHRAATLNNT
ncbi:uncharacterized protein At1g51745 [Beta vulgaris subsp. vulgaris]|uniref:uncharacterized protein At1g51745 n=1 Tax=Beta vulgaris subsp. vulgaris TaxID=3555 RepID=UPI002036691D|nr:uncharacterized protein At1g51745 [Beta vulgaris subsp. vulgaris]